MGMVWAMGGGRCAGLGRADIFDSDAGRKDSATAICILCVCSCSAQGVVFSSRHGVELRPYSYSIPLYRYHTRYFRQKVSFSRF